MNEGTLAVRPPRAEPEAPQAAVQGGVLEKLLVIAKASRALLGVRLAEIGLNVGQDQMIALLSAETPCKVGAVADALNVRPSTVSKMADRLTATGLVEKGTVALDARCTELRLTEAGEAKKLEVARCWDELEAQLVRAYPVLDDPSLRDALDEIDTILRARLSRLR